MTSPTLVSVSEGRPVDVMQRAALLALALAEHTSIRVHFAGTASSWRAGLRAAERAALQALAWDEEETCPRAMWWRTGAAPSRAPAATRLLLLHNAAPSPAFSAYDDVCGFTPFAPVSGVRALPLPVDIETFAPQPLGPRGQILVLGCGDAALLERHTAWLQSAGATVHTLDPYQAVYDAAARARLYAACSAVWVAAARVPHDHAFLWEAISMGRSTLQAWADAPSFASAAGCASAMQWHLQGGTTLATPPVANFAAVAQALLQDDPTPNAQATPFVLRGRRMMLCPSLTAAPAPPKGTVGVLHAGPQFDPGRWRAQLLAYPTLYVDSSQNAALLPGLISQLGGRTRIHVLDTLAVLLPQLLGRADVTEIHVIHADDTQSRTSTSRRALENACAQGNLQMPTVVVAAAHSGTREGLSLHVIGASVATDAISEGLYADAPGRYHVRWLTRQNAKSERGRIFFYPFLPTVGRARNEVDAASLPRLLQNNDVDVLCAIDPFLTGGVSARALWARKTVPLFGMLHSIHTSLGASDVVMQLLSGPTLPVDCIVSPSHCGKVAYQKLFDAAGAWLGRMAPTPPLYQGAIEVIPYGIDTAFYDDLHQAACRDALGLPQDGVVLLSLGRLNKQEKNDLLALLLAVQRLICEGCVVTLVIAGARSRDGYAETLQRYVETLGLQGRVHIRVDVAAADKILMYGAADIFVALSDNIQETYGLTLLEAMAAGKPVVAAEWNGYRELVVADVTGLLVPTYATPPASELEHVQRMAEGIGGYGHRDLHESVAVDPLVLTAHLRCLIDHPEARARMGEAGQQRVRSHFNLMTQARKFGALLLEHVTRAQAMVWPPAASPRPWLPPWVQGARGGNVQAAAMVRLSVAGHAALAGGEALSLLALAGRTETQLLMALLQALAQHGVLSMDALAACVSQDAYTVDEKIARVIRCVKWGLFEFAHTG